MIVPSKIYTYKSSVIAKLPMILEKIKVEDYELSKLYLETSKKFEDISEFIYAIDVLYILECIEVCEKDGVVKYVKRD